MSLAQTVKGDHAEEDVLAADFNTLHDPDIAEQLLRKLLAKAVQNMYARYGPDTGSWKRRRPERSRRLRAELRRQAAPGDRGRGGVEVAAHALPSAAARLGRPAHVLLLFGEGALARHKVISFHLVVHGTHDVIR